MQPRASPRHSQALLSRSNPCSHSCLPREGRGAATPQLCSVDHVWKGVCGSKPSSPRGGFTRQLHPASGSSRVIDQSHPAASCISLAVLPISPILLPCTKLLYQCLECTPRAVPHTRDRAPVLAGDKDCYLHWLGRGFHPCAHQ